MASLIIREAKFLPVSQRLRALGIERINVYRSPLFTYLLSSLQERVQIVFLGDSKQAMVLKKGEERMQGWNQHIQVLNLHSTSLLLTALQTQD